MKAVTALSKVVAMSAEEAWAEMERGLARGPQIRTPTARELDALRCISYGMTEEMVAEALGITPSMAKDAVKSARYKLAAKNAAHAVAKAFRLGLLS